MVTSSQPNHRTRLVSFLGRGAYKPTRHRFSDGTVEAETRYVVRALAAHQRADEIAIVATAAAREAHGCALVEELRAANLPAPEFHPIPLGQSTDELWTQFEVIKRLLRPSNGTRVVFDITHGYRSQPFFAAAIASFVRAVDSNPVPIEVLYAAFEAGQDGITPVWELTPFVDLLDWAQQMMLFLRTGRAAGVAERTEKFGRTLARTWSENRRGQRPNLDSLGRALRDFGADLETVRIGDLLLGKHQSSAAELARILEIAQQSATALPPLADVLDRLKTDMVEPLLGAEGHLANNAGHRALAALAQLYVSMGRWAEAAATVREGSITLYATPSGALGERNQQRPSVEKAARDLAEARWNEEQPAAREIGRVRNDIEHAGFNSQPAKATDLQRDIGKMVGEFGMAPGVAPPIKATGCPRVFVNLSNHPSERWSAAQREAALQRAPEICDLPFPAVPPEAGAADIAALAERTVEEVARRFPGATHAMVQGEFTLACALVRRLQQRGVVCLSATTRRNVIEENRDIKTTRFEFVRFREYL